MLLESKDTSGKRNNQTNGKTMTSETTITKTFAGSTVTTTKDVETRGNYICSLTTRVMAGASAEYSWSVKEIGVEKRYIGVNCLDGYAATLNGAKRSITQAIRKLQK